MSLTKEQSLEKETFKPHLKLTIGDQVFLRSDLDQKWLMTIVGFDTDEDNYSDYYCNWHNSQGKMEQDCFPEECLIKKE